MSNMSHCKFRNTLDDLRDCYESMDEPLPEDEERARKSMIRLCKKIADDYAEQEE